MPPMEKVWILVYGLPRGGRAAPRGGKLAHILKAISEPVGKLVSANPASFEGNGPARIGILCPAPAEIDGLSLVFYLGASGKGRRLTFELESPIPEDMLGPAPTADFPPLYDGHGGVAPLLGGALPVRRLMRMMRPLRLRLLGAVARLLLVVGPPAQQGRLPRRRQGVGLWSWTPLFLSLPRWPTWRPWRRMW